MDKMPVRVLQVVTYMGRGGLETMLMNYYRHFDRSKVQFDFLVHRDFKADYDEKIRSLGGRIYHMPRLVPWSGSYRHKLKQFFREHPEYQIVHVNQDCLSSVALRCAKESAVPVRIAHSHNSNQNIDIKYPIKLFYRKQIPEYATDLFACSKEAGKWMFGNHSFQVIPNAIEIASYMFNPAIREQARDSLGIKKEFVIGHVGRFRPQKNHKFIIEVFVSLLKQFPEAKLLLVGDGEEIQASRELVKRLQIEKQVIFTGARSDVNRLLQAMDVYLFPSLFEGLPMSLVEAQAAGLPCLISDRVPESAVLVKDLVSVMSLEQTADEWAQRLLNMKTATRTNHSKELQDAGYDIDIEAEKLQNFYLKKAEGLQR